MIASDPVQGLLGSGSATLERNVFLYEPRRLLADPVTEVGDYRIKPYRIAFPGEDAEREVLRADMKALLARALSPITDDGFHGLGFCIVHAARDGTYFLIGRWYSGNNLMSESYRVVGELAGEPALRLERLTLFACIWEMAVYAHERDSWVRTMMTAGSGLAGTEAYLECRLEGWV